jgi:hypothetical protein
MSCARSVLDFKGVLSELLKPACILTYRVTSLVEPCESGVISPQDERFSDEEMAEMFNEIHDCQQFFPRDAIV